MAAKSTLLNMVVCLSAVCLACSAVLAVANAVTLEPIAQAQVAKTNASIAQVLPEFSGDAVKGSIEYAGVNYDYYKAEGAGYAIVSNVTGFSGTLSVMVGVDLNGNVHNTAVLAQSETPGLGAKCTEEGFAAQFRGWNPAVKVLAVKKDGGDVDAITASTITSRAYTLAVANALAVVKEITANEGGSDNE